MSKFGEVYLCVFPFTSGAASMPRPVLALFDLGADAIICRITSVLRAGMVDITLNDWAQAGLLKPSCARLDRLVTAEKTLLHRQLGNLTPADEAAVRDAWNRHMRL